MLLASALFLIGGTSEAAPDDERPDEAVLQRLRAAKTVRIEVKQRADLKGESGDEDEEAVAQGRKRATKNGNKAELSLPLGEAAAKLLRLLDLRVVAVGRPDLVLKIEATGTPESGEYQMIGTQYSGASLYGSVSLTGGDGGGLLTEEFSYTYDRPQKIYYTVTNGLAGIGPYSTPESAPFPRAMPGYYRGLLGLAARGWEPGIGRRVLAEKSADPVLRAVAAWSLGEGGGSELRAAVPALAELLRDGSAETRAAAAWALGRSEDASALPPLLAAMDEPGRWPGDRIGSSGTEGGTLPEDMETGFGLATGEAGDIFQNEFGRWSRANHYIYEAILELAGKNPPSDLAAKLTSALGSADAADHRAGAAILLGRLKAAGAHDALRAALRDRAGQVRGCAVEALESLDTPQAVEGLMEATLDASRPVRQAAESAVEHVRDEHWKTLMKSAGREPDGANSTFSRGALYAAVGDASAFLRWRALQGLPAPESEPEWWAIGAALRDRYPLVRRAATDVLEKAPDVRPVRTELLADLGDPDERLCVAVLRLLLKLPQPQDIDRVLPLLAVEKPPAVRAAAMELLGRFDSARAVHALVAALREGDSEVRSAAAHALGSHRAETVTQLLLAELAKAGDDADRQAAIIEALGWRKDVRAIGPLVELLAREEQAQRSAGKGAQKSSEDSEEAGEMSSPLSESLRAALQAITGENFERAVDWQHWWKEHPGKASAENPPQPK